MRGYCEDSKWDGNMKNVIWNAPIKDKTLGHFLHRRIPPVENGLFRLNFFFDWIVLDPLLIVSRADFVVFVLFLEAGGVKEHCCMAVESRLEALCFVRFPQATCFARDKPSSKRVGGVGLSRKPPKLHSWRCTQPRASKATAGVAVVVKKTSIPPAAAIV